MKTCIYFLKSVRNIQGQFLEIESFFVPYNRTLLYNVSDNKKVLN